MNDREGAKEAFKLGFVIALATEKLGASDLVDAAELAMEKQAKGKKGKGEGGGPGLSGMATTATGLGALGFGAGIGVPSLIGAAAGTTFGDMANSEYDTVRQAKKRYLIKKYRQMLRDLKRKKDNELIGKTLRGEVPEDV